MHIELRWKGFLPSLEDDTRTICVYKSLVYRPSKSYYVLPTVQQYNWNFMVSRAIDSMRLLYLSLSLSYIDSFTTS
jgi:hypothetical protein